MHHLYMHFARINNKRAQKVGSKDHTKNLAPEVPSISSINIDSPFSTDFLSLFYLIQAELVLIPCVALKVALMCS